MRIWEFEDNKAIPSDLVREQDFILRVRRMQRLTTPTLVLNFVLTAIDHLRKSTQAREAVHQKLQAFAEASGGTFSDMSNGDVFLFWEGRGADDKLSAQIMDALLPDHKNDAAQFVKTYHMPQDYTRLRERSNDYIEIVRSSAIKDEALAREASTDGQLTAKNIDRIEQVLSELDIRPYGHRQNIYRYDQTNWSVVGEEYSISFSELRRERFPKLEFNAAEHFFLALCGMLDQRFLSVLIAQGKPRTNHSLHLNLSLSSIMGSFFAHLVHEIPRGERSRINFELHRGDLLQDVSLTFSALDILRREGFGVVLDAVTPDMLPLLNLAAFPVDAIKIDVSRDRVGQLKDARVTKALAALNPSHLLFYRCDNEEALAYGLKLGVTHYQGWLIDDKTGHKR